jgi:hypothetical protein
MLSNADGLWVTPLDQPEAKNSQYKSGGEKLYNSFKAAHKNVFMITKKETSTTLVLISLN